MNLNLFALPLAVASDPSTFLSLQRQAPERTKTLLNMESTRSNNAQNHVSDDDWDKMKAMISTQ